jgi:hypothetical protein
MNAQDCYFSGDASLPSDLRANIIEMNRREETMMKQDLEEAMRRGELSEEDAVKQCKAFMNMWASGQRVFPVLPDYVKELQVRLETSTADRAAPAAL